MSDDDGVLDEVMLLVAAAQEETRKAIEAHWAEGPAYVCRDSFGVRQPVTYNAFMRPTVPAPSNLYRRMLSTRADLRDAITHGKVTGNRVRTLRLSIGLTVADIPRVLGVSERTVNRFETDKAALTTAEADRAYRLARIADLATDLIGDEESAKRWLKAPNRYLGGEKPVVAIETELGSDLVQESLNAISYGGVG